MAGKIKITKNGPYIVTGDILLKKEIVVRDEFGYSSEWKDGEKYAKQENYRLCRCGRSKTMPFCDDSHSFGFDGSETADNAKYLDEADRIDGPGLNLTDKEDLCFGAGFCHAHEGTVWSLTRGSESKQAKELAIKMACNCPSGRLVAWDKKTGKPIEPKFQQSISLIEEPGKGVSGPIWVKGCIEIESATGKTYEPRNRVTLCRCGKSQNKPFCDGMHVPTGFNDGDSSIPRNRR